MTCWYTPASASGVLQVRPSLVPPLPPSDTVTSPPAARIPRIAASSEAPVSGSPLSHTGWHAPSETMKASVKRRMSVVFITSCVLHEATRTAVPAASAAAADEYRRDPAAARHHAPIINRHYVRMAA